MTFNPSSRTDYLTSAFVQDQIQLHSDFALTLGSKFEHNSYTGFEFQPNLRVIWTPESLLTVWGAASRAVRTPSRAEHDVSVLIVSLPFGAVTVNGNRGFTSELMDAFEVGLRYLSSPSHSVELALFYNRYDDLRTVEPTSDPFVYQFENRMLGTAFGFEVNNSLRLSNSWRLGAGYSYLGTEFRLKDGSSDDTAPVQTGGDNPRHQFHLFAFFNPLPSLELDGVVYFVDKLSHQSIPSYWRLDLRASWDLTPSLKATVGARNILLNRHREYGSTPLGELATEVPRTASIKLDWRF